MPQEAELSDSEIDNRCCSCPAFRPPRRCRTCRAAGSGWMWCATPSRRWAAGSHRLDPRQGHRIRHFAAADPGGAGRHGGLGCGPDHGGPDHSAILKPSARPSMSCTCWAPGNGSVAIRGRFIPMIDVAQGLGFVRPPGDASQRRLLLVETENQGAMRPDRGPRSMTSGRSSSRGWTPTMAHVPGVSAATVLGDGKIALILDPEAIAHKRVTQTHRSACSVPNE